MERNRLTILFKQERIKGTKRASTTYLTEMPPSLRRIMEGTNAVGSRRNHTLKRVLGTEEDPKK